MYPKSAPVDVSRNCCKLSWNFFGALKSALNEKSYIFWKITTPEISVRLFEKFQILIAFQVWCLGFTKILE